MQLPTIRAGMPHISGAGDEVMMSIAGHVSRASEESNPRDRCFRVDDTPLQREIAICLCGQHRRKQDE